MEFGYVSCEAPMSPDMDKVDLFVDDESEVTFEIPKVHYSGEVNIFDLEPLYGYKSDTIIVKRGSGIVEYTQFSNFDVLVKDENGKPVWLNGMEANMCGFPADEVIDYRPAKEYWLTEYDLEKSEKKRYKVTLEETSAMDESDFYHIKSFIKEEKTDLR